MQKVSKKAKVETSKTVPKAIKEALRVINDFDKVKLSIELVPKTSHYYNLRERVSAQTWEKIKKEVFSKANFRCEICGGKGSRHPVECHEIWSYDDVKLFQKLMGFIALCPSCHGVKHIGLKFQQGFGDEAINHLAKVNGWDKETTLAYYNTTGWLFKERSKYKWRLDLSWARDQGIEIKPLL